MSAMVRQSILSLLAWSMLTAGAFAEDSFTLTGMSSSRLPPVTFSVEAGSATTECRGGAQASMMRCMLFDSASEADIKARYVSQITGMGWAPATPPGGAAPGLVMFRPANATERCPPVIMMFPAGHARYAPNPMPEGKTFYVISYSPDLLCVMGRPPL